jgi:hypothetical protein
MEENAHTRNSGGTAMENHDTFGSAKLPSEQLEPNLKYILNLFQGDDTLRHRFITNKGKQEHKFCIIYADGMVDSKLMSDNIVRPLMQYKFPENCNDLVGTVQESVISVNSAERTQDVEKIVQAIVYGDSALLLDGSADVLILDTKGWSKRAIEEPESERVLRGPREGFNEALLENISMIRRRLRTPDLKLNMLTFGRRTRTKACLCYLDSLVDKRVLEALKSRLSKIDIDGTLDTQYIAELVRDKPYAGIDTVGSTERPDVAVAKMLEGRIVLILDGSPQVMTVPYPADRGVPERRGLLFELFVLEHRPYSAHLCVLCFHLSAVTLYCCCYLPPGDFTLPTSCQHRAGPAGRAVSYDTRTGADACSSLSCCGNRAGECPAIWARRSASWALSSSGRRPLKRKSSARRLLSLSQQPGSPAL